jgi:hypothetical protein
MLVPIKLGLIAVTVVELSPNARIRLPLWLWTTYRALGTGKVAKVPPVDKFNTTTAPGGCPVTGAVGTATYPVPLSVPTNILSVGPGSAMFPKLVLVEPDAIASLALSTSAIELFAGLKTNVNRFDGESAIRPGALVSETVARESWSSFASTIFRTGALPKVVGCNGLETNARKESPLVVDALLELPQDTMATLITMSTAITIEVLFKPETPKSM